MNLQGCLETTRRKFSPCDQKISVKCCSQIPALKYQGVAGFTNLYEKINSWPSEKFVDTFWQKAQNWLETFISLRGKRIG